MITAARAVLANWKLIGIAVLLGLLGLQTVRVADGKADLANERATRAAETSERNRIALRESERVAGLQLNHAAQQQEIFDVYESRLKTLQDRRNVDAADAQRVRQQLTTFAARDREAARTDPTACERVADRSAVLADVAAEGRDLLAEGRRVVQSRDAEVRLLLGILRNDRVLMTPTSVRERNGAEP
ncbi:hypothetical protein [Variovorax guangxiensis]|uniref:Uncharacterized protein n=1 Tax=Variovorax guangxiensis TaxID=1775474 RepID=A0A502DXJ2_9BURK|nr:hypothetical protein [Variovorax guangxiensis]TPG26543.1 hypothetical protein EAH83_01870 [Variovorax ginsengisoli]TPG30268.1 hypothetical protein EAH82_01870 [Variovorax guangxiensis]